MNRALISDEGASALGTLSSEPQTGVEGGPSQNGAVSPSTLTVPRPADLGVHLPAAAAASSPSAASALALTAEGLPQPVSRPRSPLPSGVPSANPFFGSSASTRERLSKSAASAQSGSGKVISGLQSDLLQARTALESTRGQLRLSQRAVEHLGRQTGES